MLTGFVDQELTRRDFSAMYARSKWHLCQSQQRVPIAPISTVINVESFWHDNDDSVVGPDRPPNDDGATIADPPTDESS